MLMQREHETIQAGSLGAGGDFRIAASAKAFEILSSNLYQNKILAVIRETVCNAADAHTVAKRPISDIQVHLPTYTETYFAVRDFGSGLSRSDVLTLYTTYFQSTKDNDNSLIGGFGLGSKSPFAVADQFTVTSWHGGTKNTYVCYKQDGLPRVNEVVSTPCGAETGIEVRVAVPLKDLSATAWEKEAQSLFRWWPEKPALNIPGAADDFLSHPKLVLLKSDTVVDGLPAWTFYRYGAVSEPCVVMGRVPYRLNLYAVTGLPPDLLKQFIHKNLVLSLPIGTVDISPSREALSYDTNTSKVLVDILSRIVVEIGDKCTQALTTAKSLTEARQLLYSAMDGSPNFWHTFKDLFKGVKPQWQGKPVEEISTLQLKGTPPMSAMSLHSYRMRRHWKSFQSSPWQTDTYSHAYSTVSNQQQFVLWTEKLSSKIYRILRHNYAGGATSKQDVELIVLHGVPYVEAARRCEEAGMPAPLDILVDLEAPPKTVVGTSTRAATTQFYVMTAKPASYSYVLSTSTLDMRGGGLYVPFSEGHPKNSCLTKAYATLMHRGLLKGPKTVVGISQVKLAKSAKLVAALAANGWKPLESEAIADEIDNPALAKQLATATFRTWRVEHLHAAGYRIVAAGLKDLADTGKAWPGFDALATLLEPNKALFAGVANAPAMSVYSMSPVNGIDFVLNAAQAKMVADEREVLTKLRAAYDSFVACHPLLKFVAADAQVSAGDLRSYINR